MKRVVATSLIVLLFMLSTAGGLVATLSPSHLRSINVTPKGASSVAQYQTAEPIIIRGNSDFALFGATGVGTPSDPYRFENLAISTNLTCIDVEATTAYFVISNCRLEANGVFGAILFTNVENGRVVNCEIIDATYGITVIDSVDISIENTTIYDLNYGIYLSRVSNSTIIGCTTFYNYRGIVLERTDHCQIRDNLIYANWQYGIEIALFSHNNSVYGNSIGWNDIINENRYNVIDTGEDNYFDDNVSIGNYWSDFNESESYVIPGAANSVDSFAQLLEDDVNPVLVPLYDTAIDVDRVGNSLTWLAFDVFPRSYVIAENAQNRIFSVWLGGEITMGLDHLAMGTHTITIIITDGAGNEASDEVLVSVVSFVLGGIGTELVMIASGLTVASFVIIIILSKKLSSKVR
jgi:parallel beta-helix repeat protein